MARQSLFVACALLILAVAGAGGCTADHHDTAPTEFCKAFRQGIVRSGDSSSGSTNDPAKAYWARVIAAAPASLRADLVSVRNATSSVSGARPVHPTSAEARADARVLAYVAAHCPVDTS